MVSNNKNTLILVGLVAVSALGILYYRSISNDVPTNSTNTLNEETSTTQASNSEYANGNYSATGAYVSPGGQEEVNIEVLLNNGIIESVEFTPSSSNATSLFFQEKFQSGYKDLVVGKDINEVNLTQVAGSSLTPIGFNDAIENIKSQARS